MNLFPFLLTLMAIGLYANNISDTLYSNSQKWFHSEDFVGLKFTYTSNSTDYGIFFFSNSDWGLWSYKKGDFISTDSSIFEVVDVNHTSNTVVIAEVDCCPQIRSDTLHMGIYCDSFCYNLENGAIRFTANTSSTATFRYYKMKYKKVFALNGDTCIIEGRNITHLHIKNSSVCDEPILTDTIIPVKHLGSRLLIFNSGSFQFYGYFECSRLDLQFISGDYQEYRLLNYQGILDSIDITLSLGDVYTDEVSGVAISLAWTVADGNLKNLAGFKIYSISSLSSKKKCTLIRNTSKYQQYESIMRYNIIGKKLPNNKAREQPVIFKQIDKKALIIW